MKCLYLGLKHRDQVKKKAEKVYRKIWFIITSSLSFGKPNNCTKASLPESPWLCRAYNVPLSCIYPTSTVLNEITEKKHSNSSSTFIGHQIVTRTN